MSSLEPQYVLTMVSVCLVFTKSCHHPPSLYLLWSLQPTADLGQARLATAGHLGLGPLYSVYSVYSVQLQLLYSRSANTDYEYKPGTIQNANRIAQSLWRFVGVSISIQIPLKRTLYKHKSVMNFLLLGKLLPTRGGLLMTLNYLKRLQKGF